MSIRANNLFRGEDVKSSGSPSWIGANLGACLQATLLTILLTLILLFTSGVASALNETLFVDSAAGGPSLGTAANPYHTIQEAILDAETRDTVIVLGNTAVNPRLYAERIDFRYSAGGDDVTVVASPTRSVLMYGFRTRGAGDGLTIESFQITIPAFVLAGNTDARRAIHVETDFVEIRDNYFFEIPGWAIISSGSGPSSNWPVGGRIIGNHMYRIGVGLLIFGHDWLVQGNEIERLVRSASVDVDADYSRGFGTNLTFRRNWFHGTLASEIGASHTDGFQTFGDGGNSLHGFLFEENIVESFGQGIIMTGEAGVSNVVIRNNVFDGGDIGGAHGIEALIGVTNVTITNNLIANTRHHGVTIRMNSDATIQNNIFFNAGSNYHGSPDSPIVGGHNIINVESHPNFSVPSDLVGVNPQFINPNNWVGNDGIPFTNDDGYRLKFSSPAVNAGMDTGVTRDMFGFLRAEQGVMDIGPHEFLIFNPMETWVDFGFTGSENGSLMNPFDTLTESLLAAAPSGTVMIKGDTSISSSMEFIMIQQPVTLMAVNGTVRIGGMGSRMTQATQQSGFVSMN